MKKNFTFKFMLLLFALVVGIGNAWAQTTVSINSFSATSGNIDNNISYTAYKGNGTSDPAISSNTLRIYKPSSGNSDGGYITISAAQNYKISSVTITNANDKAGTIKTSVDNGSLSDGVSLAKQGSHTVDNITASSVSFYNCGSDRLSIAGFSVTYASTGGPVNTYAVNFDAGAGTFVGNSDFPNASNSEITAGNHTLPSATRTGYTFNGWVVGNNQPITGVYNVSGDVDFTASYTLGYCATYGVSSTSAVTTTGTAPSSSNATFSQTFNTACQITSNNSMTLTLSGYDGKRVKRIVLSMKSNGSAGSGWMYATAGTTTLASIGSSGNGVAFSDDKWNGEYTTTYNDVEIDMSNTTYDIQEDENVVIYIEATVNSLYCQSFKVYYEDSPNDPSISIANASLQLEYPANQNGSFTVEYTNFDPEVATAVLYTDENCTEAFPTSGNGAWIILDDDLENPYTSIPFKVSANTGNDARSVYMKVEAMNAEFEVVDAVFQINQAKQPQFTITYAADGGTGTMTDNNLYHENDVVTLQANTFTAPADKIWDSWSAKDSENNDVTISNGQITMPASNVTVTAQWINDPNAPTYAWVETSLASLTSTDVFVIVGTRTDETYGGSYAMSNHKGTGNPPDAIGVTIANGRLTANSFENIKWNISGNSTDGYTFYPAGNDKVWLYCTNNNNGVRVGTNDNKTFNVENGYMKHDVTNRYVGVYLKQDWRCYTDTDGNIANQTFTFYKRVLAKEITGIDNSGGYYLISSPLAAALTPSTTNGFLREDGETDYYDLYYFDQASDKEWKNYKQSPFNIASGKGYLYANKSNTTLLFDGAAYTGNGNVTLSFTSDAEFEGWNLIGNPFPSKAYLDDNRNFYRMNDDGDEIILSDNSLITPMEGIFVHAANAGDNSVTFTTTAPSKRSSNSRIVLNIIGSNDNVIDRAIVRLDEGSSLEKLMINNNNTKIYIPQDNAQFALAVSNAKGSMPVNFKAAETGKYTISVNAEGLDMDYFHLIDRLTGEDINLLLEDSYSFIASKQDPESRFILSFTANSYNNDADATFAYQNGNEIIVNGEGELQIFDVTGRKVMTTTINGVETINGLNSGVYIFRVIGETLKTQKIVVR